MAEEGVSWGAGSVSDRGKHGLLGQAEGEVSDVVVRKRRALGKDWLDCPVCDRRVSLADAATPDRAVTADAVHEIDRAARRARDLATAAQTIEGKRKVEDFDVFLCHNSDDKPAVRELYARLLERGLLPWFDAIDLRPGIPWQKQLEEQIGTIRAAAVFVGAGGMGPWEEVELNAFLCEFVRRGCPVIPVLLPDAPTRPDLPLFLKAHHWVDLRVPEPDPLDQLAWGITGERPLR